MRVCAGTYRTEIRFRLHRFYLYAAPDVTLEDDLKRRDLTIKRWPRTITARLSTRTTVWAISKSSVAPCFPRFWRRSVTRSRVARFAARYAHLGFRIADET